MWRPMRRVGPPSHCLPPVLTMLSFLLEWSYFEISPGQVFQAVTFLITSEGCCALHGNEALFVSAAALLSGIPIRSCILQANAIWVVSKEFLRENSSLITRLIQRKKTYLALFLMLNSYVYSGFNFSCIKTTYEHKLLVLNRHACLYYCVHLFNWFKKRSWTKFVTPT